MIGRTAAVCAAFLLALTVVNLKPADAQPAETVAPPPPPPPPPPLPPAPAPPAEFERTREGAPSLVEEDLPARLEVYRHGPFALFIGGLVQVQAAFYVGNDASSVLFDPADTEGFRVRRARIAIAGQLVRDLSFYIGADLKDTVVAALGGDVGTEVLDAKITWERFRFARLNVGLEKVPFSAFSMESSSRLTLIERPLMTDIIAPDRRVGGSVYGEVGRFNYVVGLYNASPGITSGNRFGGLAAVVRAGVDILPRRPSFVPDALQLSVGGAYMYEDDEATHFHRVSANLGASFKRFRLLGEMLWERASPEADSFASFDSVSRRLGAAGELSAFVFSRFIQLAARYEYFHDNDQLKTFGEQQLISGALNIYFYRQHLKLQIQYTRRDELDGPEFENDIGFAQLQAMF